MLKITIAALILTSSLVLLVACGPSQADLDGTATQVSVEKFASQTAAAPTDTPVPTETPIPTDTPIPTPTSTPTPSPTIPPTYTAVPEVSEILEPGGYALSSDYYLFDLGETVLLTGPYFPFYIGFPKEGFEMTEDLDIYNEGKSIGGMWFDESQLVGLSIFIEPAEKCQDAVSCRDGLWASVQDIPDVEYEDVVLSEYGNYATVERTIPQMPGTEINQRNFNAELVKEDHWIDIHLSKAGFESGDEKIFTDFLDQVEYVERSPLLMGVAEGLYNEGAYELSLQTYNNVIAMGGPVAEMPITYKLRAQVLAQMGDYEAAIDDLLYGSELDDSDSTIYNQVCWNYGLIEKPDLALPYCDKAIEIDPNPRYLDSRGLIYTLLGDYDAAIADFRVVVDELEGSTDPHLKELYNSRKVWLEALESGENPITQEVLAELRSE